jgi:ABC-type glutathione transport system ATPase component
VAIVGESGAGKSTLVRALLALERPLSGTVAWCPAPERSPVDVRTLTAGELRAARPRFQVVFQDSLASLDPRWTARATLREAFAAGGRTNGDAAAIELLERVGLAREHLARLPHEMSGGQRQRLCLARALATQPELIALDEPVAALDASVQAQVLELLADLRRERGLAYVLVTHDLALVAWLADRVLVLDHGRIVEQGDARDVLRDPRHAATRALVEARQALEA